jgi:hypothetical protein
MLSLNTLDYPLMAMASQTESPGDHASWRSYQDRGLHASSPRLVIDEIAPALKTWCTEEAENEGPRYFNPTSSRFGPHVDLV